MTKKLEEEFNLPSIDDATMKENADATQKFDVQDVTAVDIEDVQTALTNAEKIDHALQNVKGLEEHDLEMDDRGQQGQRSGAQIHGTLARVQSGRVERGGDQTHSSDTPFVFSIQQSHSTSTTRAKNRAQQRRQNATGVVASR